MIYRKSLFLMPVHELLEYWEEFIEECTDGYKWDFSEYKHEIYKRDLIQIKVDNNEIDKKNMDKLILLDERFKNLLQKDVILPNEKNWWNQGVLKEAGDAYSNYMLTGYGIQVKRIYRGQILS